MKAFVPHDYVFASSVADLTATLQAEGDSTRIIAGGTTIHELGYHQGLGHVRRLVDITKLPLSYIERDVDDVIGVGATTTFTQLLRFAETQPRRLALLVDTIRAIRPMQVRNVGTVGGSICSSLPFFDVPAALMALDAEVVSVRPGEQRTSPLEQFFWDFFLPDLRYGEVLTEVRFRLPDNHTSGAFQKFETNSVDWALVSVAVNLKRDGDRMRDVRVVVGGGIGRRVTRARHVEQALEGNVAGDPVIAEAARNVADDVTTFNDFRGSSALRTHLLTVYIRRCVARALARIP